jgi:hypothetical protein
MEAVDLPKTKTIVIELCLRQDLFNQLSKKPSERDAFINLAIKHELDPPIISTETVAAGEKCGTSAARDWALNNGVYFVGRGRAKIYLWTNADIARFRKRPKPGRR